MHGLCYNGQNNYKHFEDANMSIGRDNLYPSHRDIINLWLLRYGNQLGQTSVGGLCFGYAFAAMMDFSNGQRGVERFNQRLKIMGKYPTKVLNQKLSEAEKIKKDVFVAQKVWIEKLRNDQKNQPNDIASSSHIIELFNNLSRDEYYEIIAKVINSDFLDLPEEDDLTEEEKNSLILYFLNEYIGEKKDINIRLIDEIYIKQKINASITEFCIQKKLRQLTNIALNTGLQNNNNFDEDEGVLLDELNTFVQNIGIGQNLDFEFLHNTDIVNTSIYQNSLASFLLTSSIAAENQGLIAIETFLGTYSKKNLSIYFNDLEIYLAKISPKKPIHFELSITDHAILFTYIPSENDQKPAWVFFDSNGSKDINPINENSSAKSIPISEHSKHTMCDFVFHSFTRFNKPSKKNPKVTLSTTIYSSKKDASVAKDFVDRLNQSNPWQALHQSQQTNPDYMHLTKSLKPEEIESIYDRNDKKNTFYKRNKRDLLTINGVLGVGFAITGAIFGSLFSGGVLAGFLILAAITIITANAITWHRDQKKAAIEISKRRNQTEQAIHQMQHYPAKTSHRQMRSIFELIPKSRTIHKEKCYKIHDELTTKLVQFFNQKKTENSFSNLMFVSRNTGDNHPTEFSNHASKIYDELLKVKSDGAEIVLSRAASHAFNAVYYQSFFSTRSNDVNELYKKIVQIIDVDATIQKIFTRIKALAGKVYGFPGGTPIKIEGKVIRVSKQVSELYYLLEEIKSTKPDNKAKRLKMLAEVLSFAQSESSIFSSNKNFIRHDDVWRFFRQVNEMLVIKNDASIDLNHTAGTSLQMIINVDDKRPSPSYHQHPPSRK